MPENIWDIKFYYFNLWGLKVFLLKEVALEYL